MTDLSILYSQLLDDAHAMLDGLWLSDLGNNKEIEVTPEMIEAGASALASHTDFYETVEAGAERIFKRMDEAR